jgi:hypothetical protein
MGRQVLAVIRHGKRLDEVEAFWRMTADRPWDPPLWTDGLVAVRSLRDLAILHQHVFRHELCTSA